MIFVFNIIFSMEKVLNISLGDIPATTSTSRMESFGTLLGGFQPLALADTGWWLYC